jgi:hypothetical protein
MFRNLRYGFGGLLCAAMWIFAFSRIVAGDKALGGILLVVTGVATAVLIGLYNRDPEAAEGGVIEAILDVLHWW